jgi:acyl carrier protein
MYNQEIIELVNEILQTKFELAKEALVPTAKLKDDLRLDSLDFVDLVVMLEDKSGSQVNGIDFTKIQTLEDIYKLVAQFTKESNEYKSEPKLETAPSV